jgi:diaminohydroxyphosphoribosylaminopyrimidine deaminase/5-amino-6-(5-phosphoribosylamino)uracil reductase
MARNTDFDARMMRRCLDLGARAGGRTSPNPMVGAVVVRGRRVISMAWHRRAGAPHAEAAALKRAGRRASGSTLYVNLEPCCHYGRTPPCVDAIIAAGVRRVVAAHRDPFPLVNGRGFAALRRAGVEVRMGPLKQEAARLNERYLTRVTQRRPFVLVKAAMTLDGRIGTAAGESKWISSARSRAEAHRMRAGHDAVMVGVNTALADDPRLTARGPGSRSAIGAGPIRVVVDSHLRLGPKARIFRGTGGRKPGAAAIVYTGPRASGSRLAALERVGARVVRVNTDATGRVDLREALRDLARRGVTNLMIEGGGELIASAFEAGLVDRVALFIAPLILGGRDAVPVVGGRGISALRKAIVLREVTVQPLGPDLLVRARVARRR